MSGKKGVNQNNNLIRSHKIRSQTFKSKVLRRLLVASKHLSVPVEMYTNTTCYL